MVNDNFSIKPYHWWTTLSIAVLLHGFLLINYKQENAQPHDHADAHQDEIIIGLKKLKSPPPSIEKPIIVETPIAPPVRVEPVKPSPVIKKKKTIKPKPVVKLEPSLQAPKVSPLNTSKNENNTNSNKVKKNLTNVSASSAPISAENERTFYYAKLAQWLERHKKYPTIARKRNQQGSVTIQFVMNRQGELLRYKLVKSSKHHSLNSATIKMLERASPMPVPPKQLIKDKTELEYTIPVTFNLIK